MDVYLFSSTVLFVPRDLYSTCRLGRSHAEMFCHRVPWTRGWAASSCLLGKGKFGRGLSVLRRKMFVGTEAAPILQEHRCSLRSTAPLAMCAVQPGFPGGGTARRDPERCSVPGTTPGLQPWWDLLAPSTGKSSQGWEIWEEEIQRAERSHEISIPGKVIMPGDSEQVPLLPKDMAEDPEMSAFGMSSLQNRMSKDRILKNTSSPSL